MDPVIGPCISIINTTAKLAERVIAVERLVDELSRILRELGEVQLQNALETLDKGRDSNDPRRELESAINHLETALSFFQKDYDKADYRSPRQRLTGAVSRLSVGKNFDEPDNDHRYDTGKRICYTLAIMVTIYDAIGEHTLALRFAERLRDKTDKAYPSSFYIGAAGPNSIPASSVDPDSDVGNWFSGSRDLEGAFSFFESVNEFLMRVGASPINPKFGVRVRHLVKFVTNTHAAPYPRYHYSPQFTVSSRRYSLGNICNIGELYQVAELDSHDHMAESIRLQHRVGLVVVPYVGTHPFGHRLINIALQARGHWLDPSCGHQAK